jgi:electron transfer flavoprotein alpha subunit
MIKRADLSIIDDCQSFISAFEQLVRRERKEKQQ